MNVLKGGRGLTQRSLILLMVPALLLPAAAALAQVPVANTPREVWVAIRADGQPGAGTVTDPFEGSGVEKLNALFGRFRTEYGDNLTIHFGPGVYEGDRTWEPASNWKIRGAGMDITIFRTRANPKATATVGFQAGGYTGGPTGFEISDVTFDFNALNLRRPNRAFIAPAGGGYAITYVYVDTVAEWAAETTYKLGDKAQLRGAAYIALQPGQGKPPAQGEFWSVLRPNKAAELPAWEAAKSYQPGEAVKQQARGYLCVAASTAHDPATDATRWQAMDPAAVDPDIHTTAVFLHAKPPGGGHRATRVKAINGNGSWFYGREAFLIGLGGNDCVIEDCVVEQFRGDYASLIVTTFGQHGVIRGCTVRGNDGLCTMAYGGWACWDTVFEDNFCTNVRSATNIDSLNCRNVTFRNNTFMNCREVGILVNVGGNVIGNLTQYTMPIDGQDGADFARSCMDGLFIYDNLVQMRDGAPFGAIQAQQQGLRNVCIRGNTLRTTSGHGKARAIGVLGAENVAVYGNVCEPGMSAEAIPQAAVWRDNVDLLGKPMCDLKGQPLTARAPGP